MLKFSSNPFILLLLFLNLVLSNCSDSNISSPKQNNLGTLCGSLTDSSSLIPITNAVVTVENLNKSATTDTNGFFRIDSLIYGNYTLSILAPYYNMLTTNVQIEDTLTVINLSLQNKNNIQWIKTNFPPNLPEYRTSIYAIESNSKGDIFTNIYGFGFYRSSDLGENWTELDFQNLWINYVYIEEIKFNSRDHIFIGLGAPGDAPAGVYSSKDNGDTWKYLGLQEYHVESLYIGTNDIIYVGCGHSFKGHGKLFRSEDDGTTWEDINHGIQTGIIWDIAGYNEGELLIGTNDGIYHSDDSGKSWHQLGFSGINIVNIAVNSHNTIFVSNFFGEIYKTLDEGQNWQLINKGLPNISSSLKLIIDKNDIIYTGTWKEGLGVYCSYDEGNNWVEYNSGLINRSITTISVSESNILFVGTSDSEIFRTNQPTIK